MRFILNQLGIACFVLMITTCCGCSGSSEPDVVTNQSDLEKWAAENPPPADADPSAIDGS